MARLQRPEPSTAIRVAGSDAPERLAFYQRERCLGVLDWALAVRPARVVQAQWLIEQVLDGARMRLPD